MKRALTVLAINLLLAGNSHSAELFDPQLPEPRTPETLIDILPDTPEDSARAAEVIVPELKGLVFHNHPDNLAINGWQGDTGVVLQYTHIPGDQNELKQQLQKYLNQPFSFGDLNGVRRFLEQWFYQHDFPVIQVVAPPGQDITSGVVQYVVVSGRLGEVIVEGAENNKREWLTRQLRVKPGDSISSKELAEDINWLNNNPFREVNALLSQGNEFGETDVLLKVKDVAPQRFFTGYENTGTPRTGLDRWLLGFNVGNLWGLDHMFSYQNTRSFESKHLSAHALSYSAPLPWRHSLEFTGAYIESRPKDNGLFSQQGRNWRTGARYIMPLEAMESIDHSLTFGYVFKRGNNDLSFGGESVQTTNTDISQFSIAYQLSRPDDYGTNNVILTGVYSPGNMTRYNKDDYFQQSRASAKAEYGYFKLTIKRRTRLPHHLEWWLDINAQMTSDSLLFNEQMGAGGYSTVRGYHEFLVTGDEGLIIRNELRTPAFPLLSNMKLNDKIQLLLFQDFATVGNNSRLEGEQATNLASVGVGLRYSLARYLTLRADYGWQLNTVSEDKRRHQQAHVAITLSH